MRPPLPILSLQAVPLAAGLQAASEGSAAGRAQQGRLPAPLPLSCLSVQLVLTAAPEIQILPPRVPSPALVVLPAIPPCHLASLGVWGPAPFLQLSRVYAWQLQPTQVY